MKFTFWLLGECHNYPLRIGQVFKMIDYGRPGWCASGWVLASSAAATHTWPPCISLFDNYDRFRDTFLCRTPRRIREPDGRPPISQVYCRKKNGYYKNLFVYFWKYIVYFKIPCHEMYFTFKTIFNKLDNIIL